MNGVDVKLARDPSFRLALAEAEHAHAGHQYDRRVRVAHGRGIGLRVRPVVLLVFLAIAAKRMFDRGPQLLAVSGFGIPGRKKRADLGANKMVGTARAETGEPLGVARVDKSQDLRRVRKVSDHPLLSGHAAAKKRKEVGGRGARVGARPVNLSSEEVGSRLFDVLPDKLPELVDEGDGVEVTLPLAFAPGKEAVSAEHDAVRARMRLDCRAQHHGQLEAGPLPGNPDQVVPEAPVEFLHALDPVGGGRERDAPVGVQVVHVREGKKAVQRRVNRGCDRVRAERAQRVVARHFVFVLGAAITAFEPPQLLQIQRGEAAALDAAEVAAAALHPENGLLAAVHGIWLDDLGAGVAAAEVGNTEVAPQQVRAIAEKIGLIETASRAVVPEVPEIAEIGGSSHGASDFGSSLRH